MEPSNWPSEHSDALRGYFVTGMSYAGISRTINARFGTAYTRGAVIGRAKRMGLLAPDRVASPPLAPALPDGLRWSAPPQSAPADRSALPRPPSLRPAEPVRLRCVGIQPRLISLLELGPRDCRYPYGGDEEGEAIAFCGHPRQRGSSYCAPHARLTRDPEIASGRTGPAVLTLVRIA